jgi:hypothetical protein
MHGLKKAKTLTHQANPFFEFSAVSYMMAKGVSLMGKVGSVV